MEKEMADFEWVSNELKYYQKEELAAIERVKKAEAEYKKAKAERAEAHEILSGVRGGIAEFTYLMNFLQEHGKLP
jgi:hypothetical protein